MAVLARRALSWLAQHPHLSSLGGLALVSLVYWREYLLGNVYDSGDFLGYFFPIREFLREQLLGGSFPLWNKFAGLGLPSHAQGFGGFLHPLMILFALVPASLSHALFSPTVTFVASAGGYVLARLLGFRTSASILVALVAGYGGAMQQYAGNPTVLLTLCAFPWMLASTEMIVACFRAPSPPDRRTVVTGVVLLVLATALAFLGGHIQVAGYALVVTGLYALLRVAATRGVRPAAFAAGLIGLALVGGLLLASPQILPTLELGRQAPLVGDALAGTPDENYVARGSLEPSAVLTLLFPLAVYGALKVGASVFVMYVGIGTLFLATLGLLRGDRRLALAAAVTFLLPFSLALGTNNPVFVKLTEWMPALGALSYPWRWGLVANLPLALLAGAGLNALASASTRVVSNAAFLFLAIGLVSPLVLLSSAGAAGRPEWVKENHMVLPLVLVLLVLALAAAIAWPRLARRRRLVHRTFVVVVALDLLLLLAPAHAVLATPLAQVADPPAALATVGPGDSYRVHTVGRWLDETPVPGLPAAEYRFLKDLLPPEYSSAFGIAHVQNILQTLRPLGFRKVMGDLDVTTWPDGKVLGMLGVRYVLTRDPWENPSMRFEGKVGDAHVYRNLDERPLAQLFPPEAVRVVQSQDEALRLLLKRDRPDTVDPSRTLLIEGESIPPPPDPEAFTGSATVELWGNGEWTIRTNASRQVYLFVAEQDYPGWRAEVDGAHAPIVRANGIFRAIVVPEGEHVVTMRFRSDSFAHGMAVASPVLLGLLLAIGYILWPLLHRWRRGSRDGTSTGGSG